MVPSRGTGAGCRKCAERGVPGLPRGWCIRYQVQADSLPRVCRPVVWLWRRAQAQEHGASAICCRPSAQQEAALAPGAAAGTGEFRASVTRGGQAATRSEHPRHKRQRWLCQPRQQQRWGWISTLAACIPAGYATRLSSSSIREQPRGDRTRLVALRSARPRPLVLQRR